MILLKKNNNPDVGLLAYVQLTLEIIKFLEGEVCYHLL